MKLPNLKADPLKLFPLNMPPLSRPLTPKFSQLPNLYFLYLIIPPPGSCWLWYRKEFQGESVENRVGLCWKFGAGDVAQLVDCLPSALALPGWSHRPKVGVGQQGNNGRTTYRHTEKYRHTDKLDCRWPGLSAGDITAPPEAQCVYYIQLNKEVAVLQTGERVGMGIWIKEEGLANLSRNSLCRGAEFRLEILGGVGG